MAEYLIYHGDFGSSIDDPGLMSIKADGVKLTVRASRDMIEEWKDRIENSAVLQGSVKDGQVDLERYIFANKYSTWTFFTQEEFDDYKKVYNSVKGSSVVVTIKPEKKSN
jgi:hypothetical protein